MVQQNPAQNAVVRRQKPGGWSHQKQNSTLGTDSGVHHYHVNSCWWEIMVAGTEKKGCLLQVLGLNLMAEVYDRGLGVDGEDDALHHSHVGINTAKVGSQDYGRSGSHIASGGQASQGIRRTER